MKLTFTKTMKDNEMNIDNDTLAFTCISQYAAEYARTYE